VTGLVFKTSGVARERRSGGSIPLLYRYAKAGCQTATCGSHPAYSGRVGGFPVSTSRSVSVSLLMVVFLAACSSNDASTQGNLDSSCVWPASAVTSDGGGSGCTASAEFNICEVPSGSTILADGGILTPDGGAVDCTDECSPSDYALRCYGGVDNSGNPTQSMPPDPSLGCKAIPIPTPLGASFYCCPCST
jgi:hypothetical protein